MIFGIYDVDKNSAIDKNEFSDILKECKSNYFEGSAGFIYNAKYEPVHKNIEGIFHNEDKSMTVSFSGNIFNYSELVKALNLGPNPKINYSELIYYCYTKWGTKGFARINGNFIILIWDVKKNEFIVARDHLGIDTVYYFWNSNKLIVSDSFKQLINCKYVTPAINYKALHTYLLFNYNVGFETLIDSVTKLRPGHLLKISNGKFSIEQYWYLSFAQDDTLTSKDETVYKNELFDLLKDTVKIRIEKNQSRHGAFLSGGMDSSSIVGLMGDLNVKPIHTFSFRCKGKSFDESKYAQIISDHYNTQHKLVEYTPEEIKSITDIVEFMDEPFSDIGIEVASHILGREAKGMTNYVLTGDGGDELFAGHPVYLADNIAHKFDKVPSFIQKPITKLFQYLPDTDKKKSLAVKLKRFSYSYNFPSELYSNRWRLYYNKSEFSKLLNSDLDMEFANQDPLKDIAEIYQEADGTDFLSKTLYGDYNTVVGFYFIRMKLLKAFGLEGRFPLFDYRLVEYAAKIPSKLKLKNSETKYILHKTMAGFLPDEIVFRKDKLGHSVPMKNWMRDNKVINEFVCDNLTEASIQKMGYFNSSFIQKMISQHLKKTHNHSHRLWAIVVLKLWLEKNLG